MTDEMKKYLIAIITILFPVFSACDMLDKTPLDTMSPDAFFKTETDLQLFSNTFYNNLLDKSPFDEQSDQLIEDVLSDALIGGTKRTVPKTSTAWDWVDLRKMNTLLELAPEQCEDPAALVKYTALTRFFRAYFYYEKVKRYGDVPWYDKQLGSADPDLYKPRDSRELVMQNMIKDIDYAIENLPSEPSVYRANRWAALALKSRFCLFEGTYRKYHGLTLEGNGYEYYLNQAAEAAEEILRDGPYKLYNTGDPEKDYLNLFTAEDANTDEYILALKFDYGLAIYHNGTAYTIVETQGCPGFTKKIIDSYLMKDGSRYTDKQGWATMEFKDEMADRDPRLAQTIRSTGYIRIGTSTVQAPDFTKCVTGYHPIKFTQEPSASGGQVDRNDRSTNDLPVFRLGEVMLNYAEAKAELGDIDQSDLDISINKLRDRAGMPDLVLSDANGNADWYLQSEEYGYPNVTGPDEGVILEIRRERTIELAMEGFRYFDLMRWAAGDCIDQEMYGMYFDGAGEYDLTGDGKPDICLYEGAKPATEASASFQIGKEIFLSEGSRGYVTPAGTSQRQGFNPARDYLYPIPSDERSLTNGALAQNPGWNDGLEF